MLNQRESEAMARVDGLLADGAPVVPPPVALRGRIMEALRDAEPERARLSIGPWALVMAACLVLAIGLAVQPWKRPTPPAPTGKAAGIVSVPLEPSGMIRLVADSVDAPMREQADRMMSDTRRATLAIVRRVPFVGRGG
jgi:hypothetical protein